MPSSVTVEYFPKPPRNATSSPPPADYGTRAPRAAFHVAADRAQLHAAPVQLGGPTERFASLVQYERRPRRTALAVRVQQALEFHYAPFAGQEVGSLSRRTAPRGGLIGW